MATMLGICMAPGAKYDVVPPEPAALIESLRSVGYTLPAAVADIVDNSIAAGAKNVQITFHWAGANSYVFILDDGCGMSEEELKTAMKPGSRNPLEARKPQDLGRFGLGLKTASLSQCRNLCVASKRLKGQLNCRTWDLAALVSCPEWRLLIEPSPAATEGIKKLIATPKGTVVIWSVLDRLVGEELAGDAVACVDRLAEDADTTVAAEMKKAPVKGRHRIQGRNKLGESYEAELDIQYEQMQVLPPEGKWKDYTDLTLTVIHATERGTPRGREKIAWRLLTRVGEIP